MSSPDSLSQPAVSQGGKLSVGRKHRIQTEGEIDDPQHSFLVNQKGLNEEQKRAALHEELYILVHLPQFCVYPGCPKNLEPWNSYVHLYETVVSCL